MAMEFFTIQETAAMLKVSPMTIRRYIATGKLGAVRVGRQVRIRQEAIEQLVEPVQPDVSTLAPEALPDGIYENDDGQLFMINRGKVQDIQPFTMEDSLWNIVGIIDDDGPTDGSVNHDKYLAEAYADTHEE